MESKPLENIVVATDFSTNADKATAWAAALAKKHAARLTIVHAVHEVALGSLSTDLQSEVESRLAEAEDATARRGVTAVTRFDTGRPWEIVAGIADEIHADLIVTGARGHTVFSSLRMGSTADRIVRAARVPVVTVHADDVDDGHILPIGTLLATTDFSSEAEYAIRSALRLVQPWSAEVQVVLLHAWQPLVAYGFGAADAYASAEMVEGSEEEAQHMLDSCAASLRDVAPNLKTVLRQGYPARVIRREAGRVGADLVVLGTHGRSGLKHFLMGSIAERTLHHASCPVLTARLPMTAESQETGQEATAERAHA